jgi:hypothetical protein
MFLLGLIFIFVGFWLTIFNRQIGARFSGHSARHYSEEFLYSVTRQNIAITGGAFILGGLLMLYLA